MRLINKQIRELQILREDELYNAAKELQVPYELAHFCTPEWQAACNELFSRRSCHPPPMLL